MEVGKFDDVWCSEGMGVEMFSGDISSVANGSLGIVGSGPIVGTTVSLSCAQAQCGGKLPLLTQKRNKWKKNNELLSYCLRFKKGVIHTELSGLYTAIAKIVAN